MKPHIYQELDLDVLIVGAGLAGLTAALEYHRKGMRVRVLERNSTINTVGRPQSNIFRYIVHEKLTFIPGDMFFLGPSATH